MVRISLFYRALCYMIGLGYNSHVETLKRGPVISLKRQVWSHKTSLTPPLFIVLNQECKQKCIYAINIDFVSFYFFFTGFRNCYDNWIILVFLFYFYDFFLLFELFRHWVILCFQFHFYDFSVELWKCSHSVYFFFIYYYPTFLF